MDTTMNRKQSAAESVPKEVRQYNEKVKLAQEALEAVKKSQDHPLVKTYLEQQRAHDAFKAVKENDHMTKVPDDEYGNLQDAFFKAHAQAQVLREFTEGIGQTDETMMTVNLCLESILEHMGTMRKIFGNQ